MMTTSAFFDRLRGVADDLDNGLRSLTVKQNVLARRKAADSAAAAAEAGTAAQKAEDLLEEVCAMRQSLCDSRRLASHERQTMESFLSDTSRQAQDMMDAVRRMEAWGAQYGYTPSFDLSLDLEDAFKEDKPEVNKDASEDAEGGEEESSASAAAPIGSPNIMEAGLTKEALERLGYKFKDGKAVSEVKEAPRPETALPQQERKKKTSLAAAESPLSVGYRSNFNTPGTGGNSFSTTTDDDTPRPIIKKTSNNGGGAGTDVGYRTPAGADDHSPYPVPKPREFHGHHPPPHEASRIEITPGLFVRRPAASGSGRHRGASSSDGRGGTTPMRKEVALKNMAAGKEGDSPKMPELQTVNLQELLAEKSRSQSKVYTPSPAKKGPAANEDEEPPTPDLKTLNLREILQPKENLEQSLGANRTLEGAENRDPASIEEKLTPDTPEFKDRFIRELARSGKKGAPTPRGRLQGAAQEEELLGASLSAAPVASPGSPQMPALSSDISKYYFDRETHL